MADEPIIPEPEPVVEPVVAAVEPVVPEPAPDPEPVHPLAPGGQRFEEVYARMKQADDRAARAEGEVQALRQQLRPSQVPVVYTADQLQAAVDRGQITPMQAADLLSRQNSAAMAAQTIQAQTFAAKTQSALTEVNQYMEKMPALANALSPEFQKVAKAAYEIADEVGLPVQDPRVQRRALRETFGTLDRIAAAAKAQDSSRAASLPHTEAGPGAGGTAPAPKPGGTNPLKDVPPAYLEFWKKRGYTQKQMEDEAKYIVRPPRTVQK